MSDLTNILPRILARGLMALREQSLTPWIANVDYSTEAAQKGATIDIPLAPNGSVQDVTPAPVPSAPQDTTPGLVQVPLSSWKHYDFGLTDNDLVKIDANEHYIPLTMSDAVRKIGNAIDAQVFSNYVDVAGAVGVAGSTPFASTIADIVNARTLLNKQLAPLDNRRVVLNPDAEGNALQVAALSNFEQTNDEMVKREGVLGRKLGFSWGMSQNLGTHTAGTAGSITVASTTAAGATTIGLTASIAGSLKVGDIFTIAGSSLQHVVTASVNVSANTGVSFKPALDVQATAAAAVTKVASHAVNLALNPRAFTFASRPLMRETLDYQLGNKMTEITDPQTGFSLRLELMRQYKSIAFDLDILWGSKCVDPNCAVRILG